MPVSLKGYVVRLQILLTVTLDRKPYGLLNRYLGTTHDCHLLPDAFTRLK